MVTTKFKITMEIEVVDVGGTSVSAAVIHGAAVQAVENISAGIHKNVVKVIDCQITQTGATGVTPKVIHQSWDGYNIPAECKNKECGACERGAVDRKAAGCSVPT